MNDRKDVAEYPMTEKQAYQPQYDVTLLLGEKYYNVKLELFLFAPLVGETQGEVIVSESNKISFITTDTWYIRDLINTDGILEVTIKRVK